MPTYFAHILVAKLAKAGRGLIVFKYSPALLVLKENYAKWGIEASGS
jgi:hypothetical protein